MFLERLGRETLTRTEQKWRDYRAHHRGSRTSCTNFLSSEPWHRDSWSNTVHGQARRERAWGGNFHVALATPTHLFHFLQDLSFLSCNIYDDDLIGEQPPSWWSLTLPGFLCTLLEHQTAAASPTSAHPLSPLETPLPCPVLSLAQLLQLPPPSAPALSGLLHSHQ